MQRHFVITVGEDTHEFLKLNAAREKRTHGRLAGGLLTDIIDRILAAERRKAIEDADRLRDQ